MRLGEGRADGFGQFSRLQLRRADGPFTAGKRCGRRRCIDEGDGAVGTGFHHPETFERILLSALHGVTHLENEAVDLAGGLQIPRSAVAQKPPQDSVVALEQFGKDDAPLRLLDDERAELGHDQPLVSGQILFYNGNQHCRITF